MHHPPVTEYDLHALPLTADIIEQHIAKTEDLLERLAKKPRPVFDGAHKAVLFERLYLMETMLASEAHVARVTALKARVDKLPIRRQ